MATFEAAAVREDDDPPAEPHAPPAFPGERIGAPLGAAVIGVLWLVTHTGLGILDPRRVDWVLRRDWGSNYVGWTFFRSAPWQWPLGANPSYPDPIGSTIGFTDSVPAVGLLFKPFDGVLPADFQYIGLWLALCFALQGWWGARITMIATSSVIAGMLGGALFVLAPPLFQRTLHTGHASLSAHWIILWFIWANLAPCTNFAPARRRIIAAPLLVLLASGLHPYVLVIAVTLSVALFARLLFDHVISLTALGAAVVATLATAALGLFAFGYLGSSVTTAAGGFGFYSADLLTLVNPMGWSRILSTWPTGPGQYEGFGYLGGGVLLMLGMAAVVAMDAHGREIGALWRRAIPALVLSLGMAAIALSETVTIAGRPLYHVGLYALAPYIAASFRASGRFIWPLHYLLTALALLSVPVALRGRPRTAAATLLIVLSVQLADMVPPATDTIAYDAVPRLSDTWRLARGEYARVIMYPPFLSAGGQPVAPAECGQHVYSHDHYVVGARIAFTIGATLNSAYVSRLDKDRAAAMCRNLREALADGTLGSAAIYLVHADHVDAFRRIGAGCGSIDGLITCIDPTRRDPFSEAVRRSPLP